MQTWSRAHVGRHMRQSLYASTHPTLPPQSSSYPPLLYIGLNRGIVGSPFHDWEFILQDKIPVAG